MEGHDLIYGRPEPLLWKGKTTFMKGQDHFYGRAGPYLWKGRMGLNSDLAIEKSLIPGMATGRPHVWLCLEDPANEQPSGSKEAGVQ